MAYWLLKSEPDTFSIDKLSTLPHQLTKWDGVRNYQARNYLKTMQKGDLAFFYHSSCKIPGIVGIVEVIKEAYQELKNNPQWYCVEVKLVEKLSKIMPLTELRDIPALKNMIILRKGNRLSVTPVQKNEWDIIIGEITNV